MRAEMKGYFVADSKIFFYEVYKEFHSYWFVALSSDLASYLFAEMIFRLDWTIQRLV